MEKTVKIHQISQVGQAGTAPGPDLPEAGVWVGGVPTGHTRLLIGGRTDTRAILATAGQTTTKSGAHLVEHTCRVVELQSPSTKAEGGVERDRYAVLAWRVRGQERSLDTLVDTWYSSLSPTVALMALDIQRPRDWRNVEWERIPGRFALSYVGPETSPTSQQGAPEIQIFQRLSRHMNVIWSASNREHNDLTGKPVVEMGAVFDLLPFVTVEQLISTLREWKSYEFQPDIESRFKPSITLEDLSKHPEDPNSTEVV